MSGMEEKLIAMRLELLEAEIKRITQPKPKESIWGNPLLIAVVGATATAIIGLITNQTQLNATRQLERDKLESSLVLKAVETSDASQRLEALRFLVKTGLIHDPVGKIMNLEEAQVPQIVSFVQDGGRPWLDEGMVWTRGHAILKVGDKPTPCRVTGDLGKTRMICGDTKESFFISSQPIDPGYSGSVSWRDANGDGITDYCRRLGNPPKTFMQCQLGPKFEYQLMAQ